jgi:uncharacterized protein (DUF305 family)
MTTKDGDLDGVGLDGESAAGVEGRDDQRLDGERDDEVDEDELDDEDDEFGADGREEPGRRTGRVLRYTILVLVLMVLAGIGGFALHGQGTPADDSVAAGLARDMTDHHAQGVDMAEIVQGRTRNPAIRNLATDIILTQTNQMGQMQGWLDDWGLSLGRSGPAMAWMTGRNTGHGMQMGNATATIPENLMKLQPDGLMPGMATAAQIDQLRTLPVADADKLFLRLMIAHHQGGIAMAQAAIDLTTVPVVVALCRTIVASQQSEVQQMTQMLQQLNG